MRKLFALLLVAGLSACSDEGPPPGPGSLVASVVGPNGAEGAAVVHLLGDGVTSVRVAGGTEVYVREYDSRARLVVVHPTGGDLTFEIDVDDVTDPPSFVVDAVAAPDNSLRSDVSAYSVTVAR